MIYAPFTSGPLDAKIVIVGQAPGKDEAAQGGAFVGRAGQELTKFLAAAGINREACRLENLFQFFPEHDDLDPFIKLGTSRVTTTPIYEEHAAALKSRLLKTSANVIISLGAISTWALTGKVGISKWRGSILESTMIAQRKCIPSIHPSYVLKNRDPISGYFITYDLMRAKQQSEFSEIRLLDRQLNINPSYGEVLAFLEHCRHQPIVAYDIETRGFHLSHISFATSPTLAMCIPLVDGAQDVWTPDQEATILWRIAQLLEDEHVEKLGQNLSFDCTFMRRHYGIHVRPVHDTMIAAAIIFPDFPKGLDFLTSIYCDGEPYYKDDGKEWRRNVFASEDIFRRYNAMDSAVLMEIFPKQREELHRIGNWDAYVAQKDLLHPLVYAGDRGIAVDRSYIQTAKDSCSVKVVQIEQELRSIMGPDINLDSTPQLIQYFYTARGFKPYMRRRKRGVSTPTVDDKALGRLASRGVREAQLLLDMREHKKMLSTYYNMKLDADGRFRCSFNPVGTVQARISSSKTIWGTGGNAQNMPAEMKQALLADMGGIFVHQDLGQAENRVVAYEACEMRMIAALEEGKDIHKLTGSLIHNVPFEQCIDEMRQDGKKGNHGLNYGLGVDSFILQYGLERERGKLIWERYHQVYPGIHEWHETIRQEIARNNRTLMNCYGRSRRFLDAWGPDLFEKAYNYKPQSTVATKMNEDGVKYVYYRQDLFPEVEFVNTVHDSIWYWIPLSAGWIRIVSIARTVKRRLESTISIKGRTFHIPIDTKLGFHMNTEATGEKAMLSWKASNTNFNNPEGLAKELQAYVEAVRR